MAKIHRRESGGKSLESVKGGETGAGLKRPIGPPRSFPEPLKENSLKKCAAGCQKQTEKQVFGVVEAAT